VGEINIGFIGGFGLELGALVRAAKGGDGRTVMTRELLVRALQDRLIAVGLRDANLGVVGLMWPPWLCARRA